MEENKQRRCILNSCCLCLSVKKGAKISGYLGAALFCFSGIVNAMTVVIHAADLSHSPQYKYTILIGIILHVFCFVVNALNMSSYIVMLVGLHKRVAAHVKFGLRMGVINLTVAFVVYLGMLVPYLSLLSIVELLCLGIHVYLLLVIRSASYNMLESQVIQPI